MMNSRPRMSPARGRSSSRNLVWIWYRFSGSCRQLRTSPRTSAEITSSCVGPMTKSPPLRSLKPQQLIAVVLPAPRLLPELGGDHGGQEHLGGAGAVHLLADDPLDLLHDPPAERQERVDAGGDLAQVAAAHHEDVRRNLRLGGRFLERGDQGL